MTARDIDAGRLALLGIDLGLMFGQVLDGKRQPPTPDELAQRAALLRAEPELQFILQHRGLMAMEVFGLDLSKWGTA